MSDITRTAEKSVRFLLEKFPCVIVLGARQAGKTTLLKRIYPQARLYDLDSHAQHELIKRDPDFFLSQITEPIILDEAQKLPELFEALRVRIDQERERRGLFLLSGSSSPDLLRKATESLAGRAAFFELAPLSLEEQWEKSPSDFYRILESGKAEDWLGLPVRLPAEKVLDSCWRGGFPEPFVRRSEERFWELWMENYFETYVKRDVRELFPGIDVPAYQTLIRMLAESSGDIINMSNFSRALDVSQPTVKSWLRIAAGTFLWRNLPPFTRDVEKRVTKAPRGHLRDSGLVNFLLRNRSPKDMAAHPRVGRLWESFIAEDILRNLKNRLISFEAFYYRTHNNAEIDLILDGAFGTVPIEIKWGMGTDSRKLTALSTFVQERRLPYGLLINNGPRVERLAAEIIQIPATCL